MRISDWSSDVCSSDLGEPLGLAVGAGEGDLDILARADVADAVDREGFRAVELERLTRHAFGELQREHAHADEVRAVDALEAIGDHRADAEQDRALDRKSRV